VKEYTLSAESTPSQVMSDDCFKACVKVLRHVYDILKILWRPKLNNADTLGQYQACKSRLAFLSGGASLKTTLQLKAEN